MVKKFDFSGKDISVHSSKDGDTFTFSIAERGNVEEMVEITLAGEQFIALLDSLDITEKQTCDKWSGGFIKAAGTPKLGWTWKDQII